MNKVILAVVALGLLGACTPAQRAVNNAPNKWINVGCHVVINNSVDGVYAVTPFPHFKMNVGEKIYWKQVNKDGTVGDIMTGVPCKE